MPVSEQPERLTITDMDDDVTITAMFNPHELTRSINVNYGKKGVLGNSHIEHEYLQTDNTALKFDLFFNVETTDDLFEYSAKTSFLESLAYPTNTPNALSHAAPPRVLIVWPRTLSIVARLMSIEFLHQRWNRYGNTTQATVRTNWEESRITRISKSVVRAAGPFRDAGFSLKSRQSSE